MKEFPIRWWDTLFFRGVLIVSSLMATAFITFALVEHRADRQRAIVTIHARLAEEARVLRVAHGQLLSDVAFEDFVDNYCHQMGPTASPGHHIIVVAREGNVVIRAHERADDALEAAMITHVNDSRPVFKVRDQPFLAATGFTCLPTACTKSSAGA